MSFCAHGANQLYAQQVAAATTKYAKPLPLTTAGQKPHQYKFNYLYCDPGYLNSEHIIVELSKDNKA